MKTQRNFILHFIITGALQVVLLASCSDQKQQSCADKQQATSSSGASSAVSTGALVGAAAASAAAAATTGSSSPAATGASDKTASARSALDGRRPLMPWLASLPAGGARAPQKRDQVMILLLEELPTLEIEPLEKSKEGHSSTNQPTELSAQQEQIQQQTLFSLINAAGSLLKSRSSMAAGNQLGQFSPIDPHSNKHIPCFFNAITCF